MYDVAPVAVVHRVDDLAEPPARDGGPQRPRVLLEKVEQVRAALPLHEVQVALGLVADDHAHDVRVVEPRQDADLVVHAAQVLDVSAVVLVQLPRFFRVLAGELVHDALEIPG